MSVRKDEIQLEIIVDGRKASKEFQNLNKEAKETTNRMSAIERSLEAVGKKRKQLESVNAQMQRLKEAGKENTKTYKNLALESDKLNKSIATGETNANKLGNEYALLKNKLGDLNKKMESADLSQLNERSLEARLRYLRAQKKIATGTNLEKVKSEIDKVTNALGRQTKKTKALGNEHAQLKNKLGDLNKEMESADLSQLNEQSLEARLRYLRAQKKIATSTNLEKVKSEIDKVTNALGRQTKKTKALDQALDHKRKTMKGIPSLFNKMGTAANAFAKSTVVLAIIGMVIQLKDAAKEMFTLGTSMDTMARKNAVVLGDSLDRVTEKAERNATAMGLTVGQYVDSATAIADLLKPMGFLENEAADISTNLVDLSGALAEWTGGQKTSTEVTEILGKAMLGEREQLKTLGIAISEADVKQRLMEKGLHKLTGASLQQAKAAATLELITEKSADAQQAYAENSDSLIRKQQRMTATFQEIKESIAGALIPVFQRLMMSAEPVVAFMAKLIKAFVQGNTESERFGKAIDVTRKYIMQTTAPLRIFWEVLKLAWDILKPVGEFLYNTLAPAFETTSQEAGFFNQIIYDTSSAFEGLRAAAKQLAENLSNRFKSITASALIMQKSLKKAVTFDDASKARINKDIALLEQVKQKAKENTRSVSEAYKAAFNADQVAEEKQEQRKKAFTARMATIQNESQESAAASTETYLEKRLTAIDAAQQKEELLAQNRFLQHSIDESERNKQLLAIEEEHLKEKLAALERYGESSSNKYLEIQNQLLELQGNKRESVAPISALESSDIEANVGEGSAPLVGYPTAEQAAAQLQALMDTEQLYEEQRFQLLIENMQRRLMAMQAAGLGETDEYRKTQKTLTEIQNAQAQKRLEHEERTNQILQDAAEGGLNTMSSLFGGIADLLGDDEKERKKHASAIKAFEKAQVAVNLASEVSAIWRNANSNPINALIPGAGNVMAAIQTAMAIKRAESQTKQISKQKFALGTVLNGPSHAQGGIDIFNKNGHYYGEAEGGEPILTKNAGVLFPHELNMLNMAAGGRKLFEVGTVLGKGLSDTTPSADMVQIATGNTGNDQRLEKALIAMTNAVNTVKHLKAYILRDELALEMDNISEETDLTTARGTL